MHDRHINYLLRKEMTDSVIRSYGLGPCDHVDRDNDSNTSSVATRLDDLRMCLYPAPMMFLINKSDFHNQGIK